MRRRQLRRRPRVPDAPPVKHYQNLGDASSTFYSLSPTVAWVIAVLFCVCALLRLPRFNVETDRGRFPRFLQRRSPPAAAGTVAAFPIAMNGLIELANDTSAMHAIADWFIPVVKFALPLITLSAAVS